MRYLIIGLGIYGTNLAMDLTDMGHEVIGADCEHTRVDAIKDYISTTYIVDSTDEAALAALPLRNVDLIIVAIGENFGASIKTVALLKKMGIKHIYARAVDQLHESILQGLNVDRILTPEQRAARDLSDEMELGGHVNALYVDRGSYVLSFAAPRYFFGMLYTDLSQEKMFGLRLIAATRPVRRTNLLGLNHNAPELINLDDTTLRVEEGDVFTCFGSVKDFKHLYRHINA